MGALFDIYGNPIRTISPPVNPDKSVLLAVTLVDQEGNPVTPGGGGTEVMTTAQRILASPTEGRLVFDSDLDTLCVGTGTIWKEL